MAIQDIKTGDIFYHESYTEHNNKTHRHKSRVLFVGTDSLFYDAWWDTLNEWTFVPVKKNLSYYRFGLFYLPKLTFNGFEPIDKKSADKLFLTAPEIILDITKEELKTNILTDNRTIEIFSSKIAFLPIGPKGGTLRPVYFDSESLTVDILIKQFIDIQNLDFVPDKRIILHRVGLSGGFPSYCIKTY